MGFRSWSMFTCTFLLATSCFKAEDIDWGAEINKTIGLKNKEFERKEISSLTTDIFAPGVFVVSPDVIIDGDFKALGEYLAGRRQKGLIVTGYPNIIRTCGNTALSWQTLERDIHDQQGSVKLEGSIVVLFEYIGGKAREKFIHLSV